MKTSFTVLRLAVIFILAFLPLAASPAQNAIAAPVEKPLLDAPPLVSLQVPATAFIGANVTFTVTFDNPDPVDPGYGPLIDLIIPTSGPDGAPNPDGLTFISATYLGSNIENTAITVPASGCIAHPYMMDGGTQAPLQVCGLTLGDTFVALRLPFGSFTPDQPPLTITVNASMSNLADLGTPLTIQARGGYQYGYNPLNDFCCGDDPVATLSSWVNSSVTPILFTLEKTYSGPEDETATGPNYPRQYTVTAQIAPGQTLSPFTMTDILPDNMQFVSIISPVSGCTVPSTVTPGGTLSCAFASASGTVSMTFSFYIPLRDLGGASVISPGTGDDVLSCNNASGGGTWTPIDSRDLPASDQTIDQPGCEHTLTDKSIATQKGVAVVGGGQPAPGRILEYTVDVQVSDFFVFDQVVVTDTFSDGQRWDTTFTPTLQILGNPATLDSAGNFNVANYTVSPNYTPADPAPNDGTTTITFRVSDEMISRSADGRLIGGCVPPAGTPGDPNCGVYDNGATTARIVFRTVIQEDFSDTFPSGDSSVDQGDVLDNTETVNGRLLSTTDATTPTGFAEADGSSASVTIGRGTLSKAVYAVNGVTPPPSPVRVASGDTVTFRLTYTLITSDFESLALTDYLPLPIFSATEVTAHNNSVCGVPAAGTSCLGPSDTYHSLPGAVNPAVSNDGVSNWVRWAYGNYDSAVNTASTIDLLFTVTVEDDPFADNMHLTNQAYATEGSTNGAPGEAASIIEITFTAPVMTTTKSAVATNAPAPIFAPALPVAFTPPGSGPLRWDWTTNPINSNLLTTTPIDSDVSGLDAGDLVTFAIFLVNEGSGINGAFDIAIRDTFDAAGFEFPTLGDPNSLNLQIYYGNGSGPIPYTGTPGDLFGTGIELVDPPSGDGVCQAHDPVSGNNVIVITYDLRLRNDIVPGTYPNTATLTNYSGSEGGPNFLPEPISDDATVTTDDPLLTKTLVGTELNTPQNSNTQVVIGELLTYTLTLTVPEGILPAAQIVDTLDAGLAFLDLSSVTFSNPDTDGAGAGDDGIYSTVMTLNAGGDCTNCTAGTTVGSNPLVSAFGGQDGRRITFDFGDLVNTNRDNNVDETITITYRAVVLNVVGNQSAGLRNNSAALTWTGDSLPAVSAPNVTIIEPVINTAKSVLPTTADAGDTVTFTVTLTNPAAGSTTAYDATWSDTLPAALTYAPGTLALGACTASTPLTLSDAGAPTLTGSGGLFQPGESCVITFDAAINYSAAPGQVITNTAVTQWTSLSGSISDRSTYNTDSDERTGADGVGGALNDYASQGSAAVTINSVQPQKSLVSTSELSTGIVSGTPRVAIGEIVRYRMVVQLPEGSSVNFQIRDNLPAGLTYLNDGTARLALLSNGTPIVSSEPTGSTLGLALGNGPFATDPWVNGSDPTLVTPAFALPDPNVGSSNSITADPDAYATNTDPFFKLGTLTNNDSDGDAEYIIVEFNALVDNTSVGSNDAGDNRNNTFSVFIGGLQNGSNSNGVAVVIAEPLLTLAKTAAIDPTSDSGDSVTYTLTITSASGNNRATAFDLNLTDAFDANLTGLAVSGVVPTQGATCSGNGAGATAFSNNGGVFAGNTLTFTATCLDPGQTITLTITGAVAATAPAGYTIPNTATVRYTSLPVTGTVGNPTGSDTPGGSGAGNGERDGSGGAVNDYVSTSTAPLILSIPLVDKLDPTPAQYVIGDLVTFDILVTLPEGVTPALQVVDDLPLGLEYVSHQVITAAASSGGILVLDFNGTLPAPTVTAPGGSGGDLTLVFGDTTTTDDNITTNNAFLVRVVTRVLNIAANQNGTALTNTANVTWTGGSVTDSTTIALLEPVLNILKAANDSTWVYGQTVTFTLSLENLAANGSAVGAHDVVITDAIPAGLTYVPASITAAGGCAANDTGAPTLAWTCVSVPLGATLNFSYQITVNSPPTPPFIAGDVTVTNTATTTWTSQPGDNNPGADDGERDGSGGVDDYSDSGSHTGGLEQYYSLGNRVWFDTDNDGTMDAGEQPVAGVLVQLYAASDLTTILASDVTNADGFYLFDYLVPGDYVVAIAADNFDTAGTYNALVGYWSSGTTINGAGAISELTAPNADTDNTDADDNGTLNGQALLPGAVVAQAVTLGPSGLTEPTGEVAGQLDPVEGQGAQPDGRANMTVDFGFYRVEIGNLVYRDNNVDGVYDGGDTLLENVTVELLSGTGASLGITTQTNALGEYRFSGLPEGDYRVRVTTPSGHVSTIDTSDLADTTDPDENTDDNDNGIGIGPATVTNVQSGVVTLDAGNVGAQSNNLVTNADGTTFDPTLDFGFTYAYALGNRVWFDTNNNSQIDFADGEVGVNGVTVQLYAADGSGNPTGPVLATDLTANGGYYLFDSLTAGDYVVVLPVTNFAASAVLEGYWSSATYRDTSAPYAILETAAPDPDGAPDVDSDDNGQLDLFASLSGAVASRAVTLGPGVASELTGETDLDGGSQGSQPDGRANMTVDFGFYQVEVGNLVFSDLNKNGTFDGSDTLIAGAIVRLYASDGTTEITVGPDGVLGTADDAAGGMSTDAFGLYLFSGLPAGNYIISVEAPANASSTVDNNPQNDNDNPNWNMDNNDNGDGTGEGEVFSEIVTLTPGGGTRPDASAKPNVTADDASGTTTDLTVDFGFVTAYALGNRVWFDTDNSRDINGSEVGVDDVLVELYYDDGAGNPGAPVLELDGVTPRTDVTANGGYYLFDYLEAGNYVVVIPEDNFVDSGVGDTYTALVDYWSSGASRNNNGSLTEIAAPDPDDDEDSDDNGTLRASGAVISLPVTLGGATPEPINEGDLQPVVGQGAQPDDRANMTVDFGFYRAEIGNLVYRDNNVDGAYDGGDTLLANVTVELLSGDGLTVLATTITNAGGEYRFSGLPEGDYIVRVTTPSGHVSTIDTSDLADTTDPDENMDDNDNGIGIGPATVTNVQSGVVTLDAGNVGAQSNNLVTNADGTTFDPTLDFGFTYAYALGNRVWFDTDNNSQIDFANGEVGVNGVTVQLYAADGSGDPTGPVLATDLTANGGYYLFDNLTAGDYVVVIPATNFAASAVLEGYWSSATYRDTSAPYAILEAAAPDPDGAPDVDSDDNGQLDLFASLSGAVASRAVTLGPTGLTEPTGESDVNSLAPGADNQGLQPDGRANMTVDFGFYKVSVGDLVWADADRDGEYDSGEPLLQAVTVNLYAPDGTTLLATTTTDANGEYTFDDLPEGTYVISVIAPNGTFSTVDTANPADTTDPNSNADNNDNGIGVGGGEVFSSPVQLIPGSSGAQNNNQITNPDGATHNPTLDFGFTPVYSLGNRIWYDTNNSRAINFGDELGIDDVRVQLFDTAGAEILVGPDGILGTGDDATGGMLTDNGGYYLFNGLEAGEYVVVIPASNFAGVLNGYWSSGASRNNDGSLTEIAAPDPDNDVDSDDNGTFQTGGAFPGAVVSLPVTLGPTFNEPLSESDLDVTLPGNQQGQPDAQANMTVDFGFYTIRLGNQVWNDLDNSGLLDGLEAGINIVTVELWSADGLLLLDTVTTQTVGPDAGVYTFTGLPQGNYIVRLPQGNFIGAGALRDYYSSTGPANGYEPAPNPDADLTDSDDNGSEVGSLGFAGGYIQSAIFALAPQAEQTFDHNQGLTTEFRVDFGVFNSPQVDLAVTKDDGQDFYLPGGILTYTIVVGNNGPADVTGAVVSDSIPSQIASWTWACSGATGGATGCDGVAGSNTDFTDTVNLPVGSTITYTVTATVDAAATGQLTNTVIVAPPAGTVDTNPSNDEAVDVDEPASLTVTKTNAVSVVAIGTQFTYDIEVTNNGGFALSDLTVVDSLPAEVTFVSAVPVPSNVSGSTLTWNHVALGLAGTFNPGDSFTIQVTVDVTSVPTSPGGDITNSVTVSNSIPDVTATATHTDVVADNRTKSLVGTIMAAGIDPVTGVVIPSVPDYTTTPEVAIGEILTYQISVDVPAGLTLTNLKALDTMDAGLAFVRCVGITSGSLTTTLPGGFSDACNAPVNPSVGREPLSSSSAYDDGRRVEFTLGDVSATGAETLTIIYEVIVLDIPANVDGVGGLNNQVTWSWDGGSLTASADPVEVVEPELSIEKDANPTVAPYGATITFTLDIAHTIDSTADAFDVVVTDILPPGLAFIPGTVVTTGLPPTTINYDAASTTLTFIWDVFPLNETALITFQATFVGPAPVINTSNVAWTSLPIDPGLGGEPVQLSPYNDYSTERWYDPADSSGVNNYGVSDSITIRIPGLPETGFAPGRVTALPAQSADKQYAAMDSMWLEIPDLGLTMPLTGVPLTADGWDLTWLSNQAGYLQGTTYPGEVGTMGITSHVTLADGTPGPFRNLGKLFWGNKIILHADGYRYVYEVRDQRTVLPTDLSVFKKDGYTWMTLLTCEGYVPWLDSYNYRLAVRAVLLSVEPDSSVSPFPVRSPAPAQRWVDR